MLNRFTQLLKFRAAVIDNSNNQTYDRANFTGGMELTVDLQLIDDPSNPQAKGGATWVLGLRSKIKFSGAKKPGRAKRPGLKSHIKIS